METVKAQGEKVKITEHFDSNEFTCKDGTLYPEKWIESRLKPLCEQLEVLRTRFGTPIEILSGYRTPEHNRKVGGARSSQHLQGRAADFVVNATGLHPASVHSEVLKMYNEGKLKIGGLGLYASFVHIDIRKSVKLIRWQGKGKKDS